MASEGSKPILFLSCGGNDVSRVPSEDLLQRFRELLGRIRDTGESPVVCGVLPRRDVGDGWLSRAIAVNSRLVEHCERNGWLFIDNRDLFFDNDALYARDGIHLTFKGVEPLSDSLEGALSTLTDF